MISCFFERKIKVDKEYNQLEVINKAVKRFEACSFNSS